MKKSNMEDNWGVIGCGWLGLRFAKQLIKNGNKVIGSTTSSEKIEMLRENGINPVLLSLKNDSEISNEFNNCDYVLLNIPPSSLKETYADTMISVIDKINPKAKVIFISSTSVYADKNQIATETDDLDGKGRNAPYIIEAEKALLEKLKGRLTIIRMAGLVGDDRHPVKYMSGRQYNNGLDNINLIHLDDCIGLINEVVEQNYFGEIINACSTEHPSKMEYYTWAAKSMDIKPPLFEKNKSEWKIVSNKKSKSSLNYHYKHNSPYEFPL